jgi:hypothetical protein
MILIKQLGQLLIGTQLMRIGGEISRGNKAFWITISVSRKQIIINFQVSLAMKILITGAEGQLGTALRQLYNDTGVVAAVRDY